MLKLKTMNQHIPPDQRQICIHRLITMCLTKIQEFIHAKISRRLNMWSCWGWVREQCDELQPIRADTGWGRGGVEKERRKPETMCNMTANQHKTTCFLHTFSLIEKKTTCPVISCVTSCVCFCDKRLQSRPSFSGFPPG